jgi:hypothetical protein
MQSLEVADGLLLGCIMMKVRALEIGTISRHGVCGPASLMLRRLGG